MTIDIAEILARTHPYDLLSPEERDRLVQHIGIRDIVADETIYTLGQPVTHLCLIVSGKVEIKDVAGELLSILGSQNFFGERGLMGDGFAPVTATATEPGQLLTIPGAVFKDLIAGHARIQRFFQPARASADQRHDITTLPVSDLMTADPLTCTSQTPLIDAARSMRSLGVSCIIAADDGKLRGILTTGDISARAVAEGLPPETPVSRVMTPDPIALPHTALVADVLHTMIEKGITHMPVVKADRLVGILTQTDLTRFQATSSAGLIREITRAPDSAALARVVARIPDLLVQLVGAQNPHQVVTRLITDICDATTRRLLVLAERHLGPPPVPYLWLACGSQGRQEQTGVSDQDNCLILDDAASDADDGYFKALAGFVCDGLDEAGYFYCPGDMMASNARWRQPLRVWKQYFRNWIATPNSEAQMLASVMFDLRPIGGEASLFAALQQETLAAAAKNSIFVAHMVSNSLKHHPPLGLFRGFASVRSGEHKNTIDLKHNGVVPVVDLARVYALTGRLTEANTRARLRAAINAGAVSATGGRDLIDAYDMIADTRLAHQAAQIRRGEKPNNFMPPADLSDFERSHLREAFVVVKTMQSAAGSSRGHLT